MNIFIAGMTAWLMVICMVDSQRANAQFYRVEPYFNSTFPTTTPGAQSSWALEDYVPELEIPAPMKIIDFPGREELIVLSKDGFVYALHPDTKAQRPLLDISISP